MTEVPITQARTELADLVNRAAYAGERVVLTRHGRAVAAIVPAADLARLESLDATTAAATGAPGPHLMDLTAQPAPRPPDGSPGLDLAAEHRGPGIG